MRRLGEGWQYTVYDIGNGRVLKKFNSWPRAFFVIFISLFPFNQYPIWKIPSFIRASKRKAVRSFEILKLRNLPPELIANAKLINGLDYEQDKVVPLHDVFAKSTPEESKKFVDLFIAFTQKLLQNGVIDKSFNATKNFGISSGGKVVLMDIGELLDSEQEILERRKIRAWTMPYVAGCIKDEKTRKYFIDRMDHSFGVK